jgi:predicted nucleotidyltransferase
MLGEFIGAILHSGDQYLNFLLRAEREQRTSGLKQLVQEAKVPTRTRVYVFGSFIRRKLYGDVDVMIAYEEPADTATLKAFESEMERLIRKRFGNPDVTVASAQEFNALRLNYDNLTQVYP